VSHQTYVVTTRSPRIRKSSDPNTTDIEGTGRPATTLQSNPPNSTARAIKLPVGPRSNVFWLSVTGQNDRQVCLKSCTRDAVFCGDDPRAVAAMRNRSLERAYSRRSDEFCALRVRKRLNFCTGLERKLPHELAAKSRGYAMSQREQPQGEPLQIEQTGAEVKSQRSRCASAGKSNWPSMHRRQNKPRRSGSEEGSCFRNPQRATRHFKHSSPRPQIDPRRTTMAEAIG